MPEDLQLLRAYVEDASEDAFRMLVERHAKMVYATALRVTRDDAAAQEVTQAVFALLSRKAGADAGNVDCRLALSDGARRGRSGLRA